MCEEYNNDRRPLGLAEAETVWYNHRRAVQEAMNNDIYTNGGLLDNMTYAGYIVPQPFGSTGKTILEREFTYEELSFISRCRLHSITIGDLDRLISLLEKFRDKCKTVALDPFGQPMPQQPPVWNNPYPSYGFGLNGNVQPLYGCPVPMEIPKEWKGETPSDISRRQMGPKNWEDCFASLSNDDVQKGPNEPDEQEEKKPSFSSSVNNKPINMKAELAGFYGISAPPEPGFKNETSKSRRVVLSPEGVSSKDDVQKDLNETEDDTDKKQKEFTEMLYGSTSGTPGPVEPGQLKDVSLKAILDYPSTGIVINKNPVPLTEENKIVEDKDKE